MLCLLDQGRIVTLVAMDGNKTPFVVFIVRHVKMKKKKECMLLRVLVPKEMRIKGVFWQWKVET